MSIEITAKICCDGCTAIVEGDTILRSTLAFRAPASAKENAESAGWMTLDHGRYYPNRHFCPACQDKPLPKLPALKRRVKR